VLALSWLSLSQKVCEPSLLFHTTFITTRLYYKNILLFISARKNLFSRVDYLFNHQILALTTTFIPSRTRLCASNDKVINYYSLLSYHNDQ